MALRGIDWTDHHTPKESRIVKWIWSLQGYVKINVDGSSRGNPSLVGFGGWIRGDDGKWIISYHGFIGYARNLLLELLAMCHGLRIAWLHGFRGNQCESDSLETVCLVLSPLPDGHHFQAIIAKIMFWLNQVWIISVNHVLREANLSVN